MIAGVAPADRPLPLPGGVTIPLGIVLPFTLEIEAAAMPVDAGQPDKVAPPGDVIEGMRATIPARAAGKPGALLDAVAPPAVDNEDASAAVPGISRRAVRPGQAPTIHAASDDAAVIAPGPVVPPAASPVVLLVTTPSIASPPPRAGSSLAELSPVAAAASGPPETGVRRAPATGTSAPPPSDRRPLAGRVAVAALTGPDPVIEPPVSDRGDTKRIAGQNGLETIVAAGDGSPILLRLPVNAVSPARLAPPDPARPELRSPMLTPIVETDRPMPRPDAADRPASSMQKAVTLLDLSSTAAKPPAGAPSRELAVAAAEPATLPRPVRGLPTPRQTLIEDREPLPVVIAATAFPLTPGGTAETTPRGPALTPSPAAADPRPAAFAIDTPTLGPVGAEVRHHGTTGDLLHVHFAVERHATAALILGSSEGLDRAFAATGVRLDTVSVEVRNSGATGDVTSGGAPSTSDPSGSRSGDPRRDRIAPPPPPPRSAPGKSIARDRFA